MTPSSTDLTPIERVEAIYRNEECGSTFLEDKAVLEKIGVVVSDDRIFVMGRAVRHDATREQIYDSNYVHVAPDAWLCHVAAGVRMRDYLNAIPYPLPYLLFERRNRLKCYRMDAWIKHLPK